MRARHDLLGCSNRLHKNASEFRNAVKNVLEVWRDQRAEQYAREDLKDIDQVIDQLTIQLQKASEIIGHWDQRLRDDHGA